MGDNLMFDDFWGWVLVILIVAAIFGAGRIPQLKALLDNKSKVLVDTLKTKKNEIEHKINKSKDK